MNKIIEEDIQGIIASPIIDWERFRNKSVLITGANGMLPSYMVFTLLFLNKNNNMNINIYALARNEEKLQRVFKEYWNDEHFHPIIQDVSEPLAENLHFDFIIHAASQASSKYFASDPVGTLKANTVGTINTLDAAVRSKSEGYLYYSSGAVYGDLDSGVVSVEESYYGKVNPLSVRNCYATSKQLGENACVSYCHQYGLPAKIVRIFHTMGPLVQLNDSRIFSDLCQNIVNKENIILHSDGSAMRAFCYVADAVVAYFKVLLDGEPATAYNVGGDKTHEISMKDLAETLVSLYPERKLRVEYDIDQSNAVYGKMRSTLERKYPSLKRVYSLGWNQKYDIPTMFKRTIESIEIDRLGGVRFHNKYWRAAA